jgi:predicted oxidoreductase (fatty acid repression mutant protein)
LNISKYRANQERKQSQFYSGTRTEIAFSKELKKEKNSVESIAHQQVARGARKLNSSGGVEVGILQKQKNKPNLWDEAAKLKELMYRK